MANLLSEERCITRFKFDKLGEIEFIGVSRAASGTAIAIPQLRIQLDAGMNVYNFHPESVFVTHCHADHSFRLTHFVSRTKPPNFFMPISMTALAESFLFSSQQLSNGSIMNSDDYELNHHTSGVTGGQDLTRFCKNKDLCAYVIDCHHGHTPSVGYAFSLKYRKLASHLEGVEKSIIARMAQNGEIVSEEKELPLFLFLGDTTPEVFNPTNPHSADQYLRQGWRLVFVECTFISDDEVENAMRTGHTHWKQLKPIIENYSEVTFVLIHFSRRYHKKEIEEFFSHESVRNIRLFLASEDKLITRETIEEVTDFAIFS
jgi:ribonuclease Z